MAWGVIRKRSKDFAGANLQDYETSVLAFS
jgi:hypothetical protein